MDYFNRSNDEELGGISCCSCDLTSTGITTNRISNIKFGDLALDRGDITIDKYDTAISDLSERLKKVSDDYYILTEKIKNLFKQERSNKLSEWREFDLEAATGREFETR